MKPLTRSIREARTALFRFAENPRKLVPRSRKARTLVAAAVVAVSAAVATPSVVEQLTGLPDGVALRLGNTEVTVAALDRRMEAMRGLYGVQEPGGGPELDRFRRDSAKSVAVSEVLHRAAMEKGIAVTDTEARASLGEVINRSFDGDKEAFVQSLGAAGTSEATVLDEIKRQLAVVRLMDEVTRKVPDVRPSELRAEFDKRKAQLTRPERRRLRNIVVTSKASAERVIARIESGSDFASLARAHSLDQRTRSSGGDLGTVTKEQLEPAYAGRAFGDVRVGGYFGPVKTQHGWNVGQVVQIDRARPSSFDGAKGELRQDMERERRLKAWRLWLGDQIRAADVTYADEYRPADPDALPEM